ncbi:hypothetical protein [Sorangium sp. So ce363]|uniref:hypothetical protein n=1 Tax=Sorangium sp. So ce363 TaxID=3133304 RepID=UPI003F63D538
MRALHLMKARLVPTAASGAPAFARYRPAPEGGHRAWAIHLLDIAGDRIASMTSFLDTEALFPRFRLPLDLPAWPRRSPGVTAGAVPAGPRPPFQRVRRAGRPVRGGAAIFFRRPMIPGGVGGLRGESQHGGTHDRDLHQHPSS